MKFILDKLPKKYDHTKPIFHANGKPTQRVRAGLENTLFAYAEFAKHLASNTEDNPQNYRVTDVFVVGSGSRENRVDSDLDLMLITPHLDETSMNNLKVLLAYAFFTDRPKEQAVDVYVRKTDKYPERASTKVTDSFKDLIEKYNAQLK